MPATARKNRSRKTDSQPGVKRVLRFDAKLGRVVEVKPKKPKTKGFDNRVAAPTGTWPMVSNAAGVHPKQLGQLKRLLDRKGVRDTEHDSFGRPKFRTPQHRAEYLRARGLCDLDAGYSSGCAPNKYDGNPND